MTLLQQMLASAALAAEPHHHPLPIMFISVQKPGSRRDALPKRKTRRHLKTNGDLHGAPHSSYARFESAAGGHVNVRFGDLFRREKKAPESVREMRVIRISEDEFLENPGKYSDLLRGPVPVILEGPSGEVRTIIGVTPGANSPEPEAMPLMPVHRTVTVNQRAWLD